MTVQEFYEFCEDNHITDYKIGVSLELEAKMVWIVTYWDFDQEPVVTPFNNRENAEKCWAYFKEIHDGCCLDECEVFSKFSAPNEN